MNLTTHSLRIRQADILTNTMCGNSASCRILEQMQQKTHHSILNLINIALQKQHLYKLLRIYSSC